MKAPGRRLVMALLASWVVGLAVPITADLSTQDRLEAEWTERLDSAEKSLGEARARYAKAQDVSAEMKRDNYPRGEARLAILEKVEKAEQALSEVAAEFPELVEKARREGVSAGILQHYEDVR